MTAWTADGPVFGVISRKPIHLLTEDERKQVVKLKDVWLDIGAKDRDQAASMVRIGDPVTPELGFRSMLNHRASSPSMDDKTGLWVAIEALRRTQGKELKCALYAVSTVQEELGMRGARTSAFRIDPHVGIAVDVCHATDCPTVDKKYEGDIALDKGPVIYRGPNMNPRVADRLIETARTAQLPHQVAAYGGATGTDANLIQVNRTGVAAGLIGVPNRYMHSPVEVVSLDDLDHAAELLAQFALGLDGAEDFTP
jgi:endoglucanase